MSSYSLINVCKKHDNKVDGYWIQDCYGSIEEAKERAKNTNAVNGNRLDIAITQRVNTTIPLLHYFFDLIEV